MTTSTFTDGKVSSGQGPLAAELAGLTEALDERHLVLDCRNLSRLDSEGLCTLIGLRKRMLAAGGQFTLTNVCAELYEVFEVTRLTTFRTVRPSDATEGHPA